MRIIYWLLPILIFIFQAIYTIASMHEIRLEEVVETFRNVWWFHNHLITDGTYSFLGWYTVLDLTYKFFGIGVYTPKLVKLFIELISFLCLASVLKRQLGRKAWLPLLVVGLSPSFMYFNSLNLSMGLEVSYFVIGLYILSNINFETKFDLWVKQPFFWAFSMFAWLTYFGFIFYLPVLGGYYLFKLVHKSKRRAFIFKNLAISFFAFIFPLIILFIYIENRNFLIYDPLVGRGLFRSYGQISFDVSVWQDTFGKIFSDIFIGPKSYYFEAAKVEFSDFYPVVTVVGTFAASIFIAIKRKKFRLWIVVTIALIVLYGFLNLMAGPKTLGGLRRGTILLVLFYGLYAFAWQYIFKVKKYNANFKYVIVGIFLLPLAHHLVVFPTNVSAIKENSVYQEKWWFNRQNPDKTLKELVDSVVKNDIVFPCLGYKDDETQQCMGLSLIYPAVYATCYYNHLTCHRVYTLDRRTEKLVELNIDYLMSNRPKTEP